MSRIPYDFCTNNVHASEVLSEIAKYHNESQGNKTALRDLFNPKLEQKTNLQRNRRYSIFEQNEVKVK